MSESINSSIEWISDSAQRTAALGDALARLCRPGDLIALVGNLGAGKTQFVRGFAAGRGADPRLVASPTFVLMSEYPADPPVVHIDAYRVSSLDELESMGWSDQTVDESITLVEWADRIGPRLPADHLLVEIHHEPDDHRRIQITAKGSAWAARWQGVLDALKLLSSPHAACPICGKSVAQHDPAHPFCSSRCRLVDLGKWFNGEYSISGPPLEQQEDA